MVIFDFRFWILDGSSKSKIQNPKSKMEEFYGQGNRSL